jgi:hypothetical protein
MGDGLASASPELAEKMAGATERLGVGYLEAAKVLRAAIADAGGIDG